MRRCATLAARYARGPAGVGHWRPVHVRVFSRHFSFFFKESDQLPTAAERGASERNDYADELRTLPQSLEEMPPPDNAVVVRAHNRPKAFAGSTFPKQLYPGHPHNFTPLRPVTSGFSALDRAWREVAWESRFDLMERRIEPRYAGECVGTPRRENQDGVVGGIRIRQVQNPYVRLTAAQKYRLNTWESRNWKTWSPNFCNVRGSRRRYRIPQDIAPYKERRLKWLKNTFLGNPTPGSAGSTSDELGEWHPPRLSGRYKADVEKQYYMNSLPWVWSNDYYNSRLHIWDRDWEPRGLKRWYKHHWRQAQVDEALKRADEMVEDYKKERRQAKRLSWIETIVKEFAGNELASPYIRQRKKPKL
eukprot:g28772.t1